MSSFVPVLASRRRRRSSSNTLLRYVPGGSLANASITRASSASYFDANGVLQTALSNVARDGHYIGGVRSLLLEKASTNFCKQSENFGTTWATVSTPTRVAGADTGSGISLDLLGDDTAAANEYFKQDLAAGLFSADGVRAYSVCMKKGASPSASGDHVWIRELTSAVDRLLALVTWDGAGVPSVAMTTGTYLGKIALAGGVYRLLFETTACTNANQLSLRCGAGRFATVNTDIGDCYWGGIQIEESTVPSSYIKTTTATVSRSADSFYFSVPSVTPRQMTIYMKFVERGPIGGVELFLGTVSSVPPYLDIGNNGSSSTTARHNPSGSPVTALVNPDAAFGDIVELRVPLGSDGSINIGRSINAAAESLGSLSAGAALTATWGATPRLYIACDTAGSPVNMAVQAIKIIKGAQTMAQIRVA